MAPTTKPADYKPNYELEKYTSTLNKWASDLPFGKSSVIVHATDEEHPPAPAWYVPGTGDAMVHLPTVHKVTGGKEPRHTMTLKGLTLHEISHAQWSAWMPMEFTPRGKDPEEGVVSEAIFETLSLLEEMRIEQRALKSANRWRDDECRKALRACLPISIGVDKEAPTSQYGVAHLWALAVGRVLTSAVDADEVEWVDAAARGALGDDVVDELSDLLQEALEIDCTKLSGVDEMIKIAERWNELVGEPDVMEIAVMVICAHGAPSDDGDGDESESKGSGGKATAGEDESDDEGAGGGGDEDEAEDGDEAPGESEAGGSEEAPDGDASDMGKADSVKSPTDRAAIPASAGKAVLEQINKAARDIGKEYDRSYPIPIANREELTTQVFTKQPKVGESVPTPKQRQSVKDTIRVLETLVIPAVTKVDIHAKLPPGRLRTREAVRASAERSQGRLNSAEPWQGTRRRHEPTKPIVVGIATDTSGSMHWAQDAVAEFAYVWTNAGCRIGARTAAVTFGNRVTRVAGPGEIMNVVRTVEANGSEEACDKALAALDGALHLTDFNNYARVLIVVSDGQLVISDEDQRVIRRIEMMNRVGTKVIWVTNYDSSLCASLKKMKIAEVVKIEVGGGGYYSRRGTPDKDNVAVKAVQNAAIEAITKLVRKGH